MDIMKSYNDICKEIEMWEEMLKSYHDQVNALNKLGKIWGPTDVRGVDYSNPQVQGSGQIGFETFLKMLRNIQEKQMICLNTLKELEKTKKEVENSISSLDGLDKKIMYMKTIQGKTLKEIAAELGYSYQYIREVAARTYKEPTDKAE